MQTINISLKDYLRLGGSLVILNSKLESLEIVASIKIFDTRNKEHRESEFIIKNIINIGGTYTHEKGYLLRNILTSDLKPDISLFDSSIIIKLPIELSEEFKELKS